MVRRFPSIESSSAALCDQAKQAGLVDLIDTQLPRRDQGLSVGR